MTVSKLDQMLSDLGLSLSDDMLSAWYSQALEQGNADYLARQASGEKKPNAGDCMRRATMAAFKAVFVLGATAVIDRQKKAN